MRNRALWLASLDRVTATARPLLRADGDGGRPDSPELRRTQFSGGSVHPTWDKGLG